MKKRLFVVMKNLEEAERERIGEQLREPCQDWNFERAERFEVCVEPLFFSDWEQALEKICGLKETTDVAVFSDDSACLRKAGENKIATIGCQPAGQGEFLEGTNLVVEDIGDLNAELVYRQLQRQAGIPWTILETERLVVREFQMTDLDDLFALYQGEGMTDFIEPLYPYEEEKAYQQSYITCVYGYYGFGMWLVFEKGTGKLVGRAGLEQREGITDGLELGYAIGTPYWRRGYGEEVCRAILKYAAAELGEERIYCMIEYDNRASVSLAKKIGFTFEKEWIQEGKRMCIMRCNL